jgi:hypothetical protein
VRCGGKKDNNRQGGRLCNYCLEEKDPVWLKMQREKNRIISAQKRRKSGTPFRTVKVNAEGQVWCSRCKEYLDSRRFKQRSSNSIKWDAMCKPCKSAYGHEHRMKTVFGITAADYHGMLEMQGYACAICKNKPKNYRLAVDHCHKTGKIRGLLCKRCNHDLLGAAYDSIPMLARAISYLEAPPAQTGVPVLIYEEEVFREGRRGLRGYA